MATLRINRIKINKDKSKLVGDVLFEDVKNKTFAKLLKSAIYQRYKIFGRSY